MPAIVSKLNSILVTGVHEGASDWHIREGHAIVLRIDGTLHEIEGFITDKEFFMSAVREITNEKMIEK